MINVNIVNNEWYFTYDGNQLIVNPTFVDETTSIVIGENTLAKAFNTEAECLDEIAKMGLLFNVELL